MRARVDTQLAEVNIHYAVGFAKPIRFSIASVYTFTGTAGSQVSNDKLGADFQLLYSENTSADDGGWYNVARTVVIRWLPTSPYNGVFGAYGADSLTHELGHARGAVDEYALGVTPANNPINGQGFSGPTGFMTSPYGATTFSQYSKNIVNASTTLLYSNAPFVGSAMPSSFSVKALQGGNPVSGANVTLYPVTWYSQSLSATPVTSGTTSSSGVFTLGSNPFQPFSVGQNLPWDMAYPNFLVKVTSASKTGYGWLPLTQVGNAYFANPGAGFTLNINLV